MTDTRPAIPPEVGKRYVMNHKTPCPKCGETTLDRVEVDIGVGNQCGPWQCYNCDWSEDGGLPEILEEPQND